MQLLKPKNNTLKKAKYVITTFEGDVRNNVLADALLTHCPVGYQLHSINLNKDMNWLVIYEWDRFI
jgi:hypothetical protein